MSDEMVELGVPQQAIPAEKLAQPAPIPVTQVAPSGMSLDPKTLFVRWWLGQEASTVILIAILMGGAYMTWWHVTIGAPESIKKAAVIFEKISQDNNEAHKQVSEKFSTAIKDAATEHARAVDKMQMSFERALDRVDRRSKD